MEKQKTSEDSGSEDGIILQKNKEENPEKALHSSSYDQDAENHKPAALPGDEQVNSNLHYEGNKCIYTDPATKNQFEWNEERKEWISKAKDKQCSENSDVKPVVANSKYEFDGEFYCYTDCSTGITYKYNTNNDKWEVKKSAEKKPGDSKAPKEIDLKSEKKQDMESGIFGYEGDTHTYTDPSDGTVYIWDKEKNAWFPKVDEDFLAHYQMSYGFTPSGEAAPTQAVMPNMDIKNAEENKQTEKRKGPPPEPTWFEMDEQHNTKVYVSNLPLDVTEQEFVDLMQKCGLVMRDVDTGRMKVKLYMEPDTMQLKGDALCTYIKVESVELALKLLDGCEFKGHRLHVERAKFQMKGSSYDPSLKPKKRKRKEKERVKKMQEKLFDWRPEKMRGERSKHERIVIVKNLFEPSLFDKEVSLLLEYQQDLREECSKCGDVRRVVIYDRHPEGVAQITFREPEEADACILLLNGRWFGQRKITAEIWDGKTKYKIGETESEIQQRLSKWNEFLESGSGQKKTATQPESASSDTGSKKTNSILTEQNNSLSADAPTNGTSTVNTSSYKTENGAASTVKSTQ